MRNEAGFTSIMTATNNREINNQRNSLDQHYAGKSAVVVKLVDRSTKKLGKQLYALVSGPGGSRYQVDVDNAITSGELVVPEQYRPKSATTVVSNLSVADELTKLKKLLQDSVITQAEYDAQKKKLLNQ
ncbi:MAG: hypothetical protein C5B59_12670 [Bacteroidetes bacterium]|nr:MAG: hypothetical protein C5B59_12670 [Bacteroidota bacterium]